MSRPPSSLKLISLNLEKDRHFERVLPFLKQEKPDVVFLQEVLEKDMILLESTLKMKGFFTILESFMWKGCREPGGQALLTNLPLIRRQDTYYRGEEDFPPFIELTPGCAEKINRALSLINVVKDGQTYCLAHTHFTWAPDGKPSAKQEHDLDVLFDILSPLSEFVLCGDFNAPRGTPIFDKLAAKFKDNIPSYVTTTLDKKWHKAGDLQLVVDGVFTTPQYHVESITLVDNLSDHFAIVANLRHER